MDAVREPIETREHGVVDAMVVHQLSQALLQTEGAQLRCCEVEGSVTVGWVSKVG